MFQKFNHRLNGWEWILDLYWWIRLLEQATSTEKSVCWWCCRGRYKSRLLHAINFWSYREVRSEAATGTSPTETIGGWGTLHPSKQLSLPRGQHQQYPIHYKGQKKKEGGKQGGERNNKHLFTVTVVTFSPIFFMIYDWLLESLRWIDWFRWIWDGSIGSGNGSSPELHRIFNK